MIENKTTNDTLWKAVKKLWDDGENRQSKIKERDNYWQGLIKNPPYSDQPKTNCNVVKQIVETKLSNILDAKFTMAVVPAYRTLMDFNQLKEQRIVADIYTGIIQEVMKNNKIDTIDQKTIRWGLIGGLGGNQVTWDDSNDLQGDIKIISVEPTTIRWDKAMKSFEDVSYIAYQSELSPAVVKRQYCKDVNGQYDIAKCEMIDELAEDINLGSGEKRAVKSVVVGQSAQTADYMNVYDKVSGIQGNKVVKMVVMFMLDGAMAPEKNDKEELAAEKQRMVELFPNGRMVVFSLNETKKIIFDDKPIPEGFKSLGNMEFFTPLAHGDIIGHGEVEDIIPIQDRINGCYAKIRQLLGKEVNCLLMEKSDLGESDFINHAIVFLEGARVQGAPPILKNDVVEDVIKLLGLVRQLKEEARQTAGLNQTFMSGDLQPGTTSGDQVDSLNESPMSSIRMIQTQFKEFKIGIGEKILKLALTNYNTQRIFNIAVGGQNKMVEITTNDKEQNVIRVHDGNDLQEIVIGQDWEFKVEVTSGTDIPRTRKENAFLVDKMFNAGILGDPQDINVKEAYLRSQDIPNYQAFISLQKAKDEQIANNPPKSDIQQILMDGIKAKAFADVINALKGNNKARSEILTAVGLSPDIDTIESAPVQELTNKGDIKELVAIAPDKISKDPITAQIGQSSAAAVIDTKTGGKNV